MRIGIECGGTFTDYVALDEKGHLLTAGKVFSTPEDPSIAVARALEQLNQEQLVGAELVHGSTVATNSLIERKGARIALVVTRGFRDLVFLRRQDRESMYDLRYLAPVPLVERADVFEVTERVDASGKVLQPIDADEVTRIVAALVEGHYEAVAVSLLHSYANPAHEKVVADAVAMAAPTVHTSVSHVSSCEFREYERTTTTTVDAFLKPRIKGYLAELDRHAAELGIASTQVMQSNGGMVPASVAAALPLTMLRSGPAAGVAGAVKVARNAGVLDLVTMDMGGTSTDVAVVRGGALEMTSETVADRLPVRVPMVDIIAVGAGGGSLVGIDTGGLLTVGPESAGADPGPVAYGRGGTRPTVTDANVVRGVIRPDSFLGGTHELDVRAAKGALETLAHKMGLSIPEFASAVTQLAAAHMSGAIRMATTERGHDVRAYTLVAYGGAGGLHAAEVADTLGMSRVLIPPYCGMTSAYGLLTAGFRREFARTRIVDLPQLTGRGLVDILQALRLQAQRRLADEGISLDGADLHFSLDMRYRGQGFEISVEAGSGDDHVRSVQDLAARFAAVHERRYGHVNERRTAQVVTARLAVERPLADVTLPRISTCRERLDVRHPIIEDSREVLATFTHRESLHPGDALVGPAVIEDNSSTIVVPSGWRAEVDASTNVILERSHE